MTRWQSCLLNVRDDRVILATPDGRETAGSLQERAATLAEMISVNQWTRIAWMNPSVTQVIIGMDACQKAGCDLFLIRSPQEWNKRLSQEYQIQAVFRDGQQPEDVFPERTIPANNEIFLTTSGTGGRAKWVGHSLAYLRSRSRDVKALGPLDSWLLTYAPASFAGIQVILTALASCSRIISVQTQKLAELVEAFVTHRPTHVSGTPSFWRGLMTSLRQIKNNHTPRQITLGGEIADQATLTALKSSFPGARIVHIYATTELGVLFSVKDGLAGFPAEWLEQEVSGYRFRINNEELEVLQPRSPNNELTGDSNWQPTGDLVEQQGDRVYFQGRIDGLINVGGLKVKPEIVESTLLQHPLVADVRIFGKTSPIVGSIVAAEVMLSTVLDSDTDTVSEELHAFAAQRLAPHMVPRMIYFTSKLALNATGKKLRVT